MEFKLTINAAAEDIPAVIENASADLTIPEAEEACEDQGTSSCSIFSQDVFSYHTEQG